MYVFIRESTATKNLRALVPGVTPQNSRRCALGTDDRHPADLLDEGHLDHLIRMAVAEGLDPVTVIQMATLNAAEWFRLHDRGAIAPGRRADLVVFSDLEDFQADTVYSGGVLVAQDGRLVGDWPLPPVDDSHVRNTVRVDWDQLDLTMQARGEQMSVIGVVPDQVVTEHLIEPANVVGGMAVAAPERDLIKIAVIERHHRTGRVGLGFVRGLGLERGALAGSVGHDAHNLTVAGCDDVSMMTAARAVGELGGGLVAAVGEEVLGSVPLPIAGLMSDQPVETVREQMDRLVAIAKDLGSPLHDPFMALGFMAMEAIPTLKLTDQGLVDVEKFDFAPLWVE
jgi:adenine deaminase